MGRKRSRTLASTEAGRDGWRHPVQAAEWRGERPEPSAWLRHTASPTPLGSSVHPLPSFPDFCGPDDIFLLAKDNIH